MITGLVRILFFQGLGEMVSHFLLPIIPGPVIGLALLLAWFHFRKGVPGPIEEVAAVLMRHLGLLFVPAAVGVIMFLPQLREHGVAIGVALVASAVLTIAASALVLRALSR